VSQTIVGDPERDGSTMAARQRRPQVVVITGAGAGVGRATVRAFARRGARIGLVGRDAARLRQAQEEVRRLGGKAVAYPCDVVDAARLDAAADAFEASLGPIDVWINNAMATIFSPVHAITPAEFRRATEVTYLGTVHGTMTALRRMRPRNRGTIVQVGSALAYRAIPLQAPYCGAKFAIRGFTDALRCELLHERSRVRLTMVQMPALNTPQFDWARNRLPHRPQPVPPIFQPEVAARAITWAVDHPRREVYVGMPTLLAIWGNKLAPGLLDRYLARNCYAAQQAREPAAVDHHDNLFAPVPGAWEAHGRFDARARSGGLDVLATIHRAALGIGAVGVALAAVAGATGAMRARARRSA
jgi:NAD(P)-dependent dehydrogenase (short-subunit alcohol dehydrogenase family)